MIALVKKKAEPGLSLEQVPIPEIGIDDVLIKVDRTGICGTDLLSLLTPLTPSSFDPFLP